MDTAASDAVRSGDVEALRSLLAERPELARSRPDGARTLLHVATDWPGHRPRVAETVAVLVAAGADPDAAFVGQHAETPLHWAASSGDLAALDALLDAGADVDAPGAVVGGGSALADATAFGQWDAARRLVERGATPGLFDAAALGLVDVVRLHLGAGATVDEVDGAFWGACHGGRQETAALLLDHGAALDRVSYDGLTPVGAAHRAGADALVAWLTARGATPPAP